MLVIGSLVLLFGPIHGTSDAIGDDVREERRAAEVRAATPAADRR
jgi:hypothetical protein